jgi:hypothetical protein
MAPERRTRVETPHPVQPQTPNRAGHGANRCQKQSVNLTVDEALGPELHSLLQLLRIARPPLAAANAA